MAGASDDLGSWAARRIVRTTFPLLVVLSIVVLAAGVRLEEAQSMLGEYGVLAIMVPTMVAMGGNLGAILSARLSTRLHLGTAVLDPRDRMLWANGLAILALAATVFPALAVGTYALGTLVGSSLTLPTLLTIATVSGLAVAVLAIACSYAATYAAYRLGIDPDDVTIPVVTNLVDVGGMIVFLGVAAVVLSA